MKLLNLNIISPNYISELDIKFISLRDKIGNFGVYPGHRTFLTFLDRSLGHYLDEKGVKHFLAYDYGIFRVEPKNRIFLISRIVITGNSLNKLQNLLLEKINKEEIYSTGMRENIENLERILIQKIMESQDKKQKR